MHLYTGVPSNPGVTGERVPPAVNIPDDGDPGQASTIDPGYEGCADEIAALKSKAAYLDGGPASSAGLNVIPSANFKIFSDLSSVLSGVTDVGGTTPFGILMDPWGFIHLTGLLHNGTGGSITSGANLGTLPAGFRPTSATAILHARLNNSTLDPIMLAIFPTGVIELATGTWPNGEQLSFDNVFTWHM